MGLILIMFLEENQHTLPKIVTIANRFVFQFLSSSNRELSFNKICIKTKKNLKMPRFCLETNVSAKQIPENFLNLCTQNLSKLTGKPEMFCVAFIQTDQDMTFGGENEPCGIANVSSIGGLGVEDVKRYCNVFFKLIEQFVGIPQKKLWLTFTENLPEYVTFKGKSFYHITMCRAPGEPIIHDPDE